MDIGQRKFLDLIEARVEDTLLRSTLDHKWLKSCPVPGAEQLHLSELFFIAGTKEELRGSTKKFVLNYAPYAGHYWFDAQGCDINLLLLWLKSRIKEHPKNYQKVYNRLSNQSVFGHVGLRTQYLRKKSQMKTLYTKLDKRPSSCDTLLYLGEDVLSEGAAELWELVHKMDPKIQVLAGYKVHSGYNYFVQGKFSEAYQQWRSLYATLSKTKARNIVVASYGSYIALSYMKDLFGGKYNLLYIDEYVASFGLLLKGLPEKIAVYHDPNAKRDAHANISTLLKKYSDVIDIDWEGKLPILSYNYGIDSLYSTRLHNVVAQARKYNSLLVVDSLHIADKLVKAGKDLGVEVLHIGEFLLQHMQSDEHESQREDIA